MNCSPLINKDKDKNESPNGNKFTCYTPEILVRLKEKFNATFPGTPIVIDDSDWKGIHRVLKNVLTNSTDCKKEDCWLRLLDKEEREVIDHQIFATDHPRDWLDTNNNNNNKKHSNWLSNFDIDDVMAQYEDAYPHFKFIDSTTIDFDSVDTSNGTGKKMNYGVGLDGRIEKKNCVSREHCNFFLEDYTRAKITQIAMVFNTANHKSKGEHWFTLFVDVPHELIFYFDSSPPNHNLPLQIKRLISRIKKQGIQVPSPYTKPVHFRVLTNISNPHQSSDGECGMYSLFFMITMLTGNTSFKQNMSLDEKIDLFRKVRIDDKFVNMYRGVYFNSPVINNIK